MADVLKLYGDLAAGAIALTWAVLVVLDTRLGKALGKIVAYQAAALFGLAALSRWYATFVGALALFVAIGIGGCAHLSVADGVTTADVAVDGVTEVVSTIDTDEARKAKELLAEIADALELLRALAPAIDAEVAARSAEASGR